MDALDQTGAELARKCAEIALPPITKASVRVMRSHDYCHFEVVLGMEEATLFPDGSERFVPLTVESIDDLRKTAARLVDKAIEQFKIAKADASGRLRAAETEQYHRAAAERVRAIAETDRTPTQQADLKAFDDAVFHANRRPYDYEDDWDNDDDEEGDCPL